MTFENIFYTLLGSFYMKYVLIYPNTFSNRYLYCQRLFFYQATRNVVCSATSLIREPRPSAPLGVGAPRSRHVTLTARPASGQKFMF